MVPGSRVQKKRHSRLKRLISRVRAGSGRSRINYGMQIQQAQDMFRGLAENSMVGVYIARQDVYHFVNQRMSDLTGYTRRELLNEVSVLDLVAEEDRPRMRDSIRLRLTGATRMTQMECRIFRKDGSLIDVEIFGSKMRLGGELVTIGSVIDISDRKRGEAANRMAALVYQSSSEAMVVTDASGFIESINPAFSAITGYRAEEVVGRKISILSSGRQSNEFYQSMWNAISETGTWRGDIWNRRKNGEEYAEHLAINSSFDEKGRVCNRIGVFSDITLKKQDDAKIWKQANYDYLTGLPNRPLLHDRLTHAVARSDRSGLALALIFIDLDFFKEVNDSFGHDMGDELLRQAAQRLSAVVRATDTVARLGGDEFVMLLGDVRSADVTHRVCRAILACLEEPFILGAAQTTISASVGVALYPEDAQDATTLLQLADLAMYASKDKGRHQYCFFQGEMQEGALVRRQLSRDLGLALNEGQFHLQFQPIIDARTGRIRKAEALLRWSHPVLGLVSPAQFIPMAEDSGVINSVGNWVFREAVRQAALWQTIADPDFQMSLNLSPAQFQQQGLDIKEWLVHLEELGLSGAHIVVEITEKLLIESTPHIERQLMAFRDAGVQISLDDFGTGYSSLPYLKKFDIDYIKIDRVFVEHVARSADDLALCEAIVAMAHKLGLKVVAEGVETEVQHVLMQSASCDFMQGYFYAKPMDAPAFEQLLLEQQEAVLMA
jgi:diguanylate cyclase (GGDEF)-like protein/PAS domain S-box-containing protein